MLWFVIMVVFYEGQPGFRSCYTALVSKGFQKMLLSRNLVHGNMK